MVGCGVKGYTASTASALQLRMIAMSVVKTSDFMRRPLITIPLALRTTLGTRRMWCLNLLLTWGTYLALGFSLSIVFLPEQVFYQL